MFLTRDNMNFGFSLNFSLYLLSGCEFWVFDLGQRTMIYTFIFFYFNLFTLYIVS